MEEALSIGVKLMKALGEGCPVAIQSRKALTLRFVMQSKSASTCMNMPGGNGTTPFVAAFLIPAYYNQTYMLNSENDESENVKTVEAIVALFSNQRTVPSGIIFRFISQKHCIFTFTVLYS